jgi:1-acyl-sn-glycerol-3-phosphate acyltransferase
MEHSPCSAPIVPAFAFGQTGTYRWWRPGPPFFPASFVAAFSRAVGFVPLLICGKWGTTIPLPSKITVVFGDPIPVPKGEANPSEELCKKYSKLYIESLEKIFTENRAKMGYPDLILDVM